jgi:hypothetical protein
VLEVDADDDGRVDWLRALGGCGDDHLACARGEVLGGRLARAVAPGGLDTTSTSSWCHGSLEIVFSASAQIGRPSTVPAFSF